MLLDDFCLEKNETLLLLQYNSSECDFQIEVLRGECLGFS